MLLLSSLEDRDIWALCLLSAMQSIVRYSDDGNLIWSNGNVAKGAASAGAKGDFNYQ